MKIALLFSGQGMQYADMLPWINPANPLLLQMQEQLQVPDWRAAMRDTRWASTNAHAQVLLTACALAAWQELQEHVPALQTSRRSLVAVAGYSIGELAAACVAGVLYASNTIQLAGLRAALMDQAGAGQDSSMLAISGVSIRTIEQWCQAHGAALAIRNGPDSAVCAGPRDKLAALEKIRSRTRGTLHTPGREYCLPYPLDEQRIPGLSRATESKRTDCPRPCLGPPMPVYGCITPLPLPRPYQRS